MMRFLKAGVLASKIATPVFAPKLTVFVPATAGSCSVMLPLVDPSKTTLMSILYETTQRDPAPTVTTAPPDTVIGPTDAPANPDAIV